MILNKKITKIFILLFLGFFSYQLQGENLLDTKLRVFEGIRSDSTEPPQFVTSSYLQPTITASLDIEMEAEKQKTQIKRVFNLQDVNILTEADLSLDLNNPISMSHYFRLNGNAFEIHVRVVEWGQRGGEFLILVNEQVSEKRENILTTEILLQGGKTAVFGFEDRMGKPYFLSFVITGPADKILPPPPPPPPPPPGYEEMKEKLEKFSEGAVQAVGLIKPPVQIKKVNPHYPEKAREAKKQGSVILNVRTDEAGNVEDVMVRRGVDPLLDQAAVEVVKQWKYKPLIIQGKPHKVVFTVTITFKLQ